MAKKKTENSFSKLNEFLSKVAPDGDIIDDSPFAKIDEWIPTGSYVLNAAISGSLFGGVPNRRSMGLSGATGSGKTYLALSVCRNAQKMGYDIIYFDSEGAIDKDFVSRLGVDTSRIRLQPVNTIEQVNHILSQLTKNYEEMISKDEVPPKIMIVLDSLGNLSSDKEAGDSESGSDKRDMTKQQSIRKLFRVNGMRLAKFGIPFIVTTHTYDTIGSYFPAEEMSGGGGLKFNASIIFMLTKKKLLDNDAEKKAKEKNVDAVRVGVTVAVKPIKQRFAKPIKVEMHIPFYKKPNPYVGLEKFVSWEDCGILRGKCLDEKAYKKLSDKEKESCFEFQTKEGKTLWAFPKDTARTLVCRHLEGEVPINELFTAKVFTEEVLRELDEKVIKPTFMLPSIDSLDDLAEITENLEEDITDEELEEIN